MAAKKGNSKAKCKSVIPPRCTRVEHSRRLELIGKLTIGLYRPRDIVKIIARGGVEEDATEQEFKPFKLTRRQVSDYVSKCRQEWVALNEQDRAEQFAEHVELTRDLILRAKNAKEYSVQRAAMRDLAELMGLLKLDINLLSKVLIEVDKATPPDQLPKEYQGDK